MKVIALTGGPGGGKSTLLRCLQDDPRWCSRIAVLEEAVQDMRFVHMNPRSAEFQCTLVAVRAASESAVARALADSRRAMLITHRGTLDPCAFWQTFGGTRESFFAMTGMELADHYRRYAMVIHLESAAVRVPHAYVCYPLAHRPEDLDQASQLDKRLGALWQEHPNYRALVGKADIEDKLAAAMRLIRQLWETCSFEGEQGNLRWPDL